MKTLLILFYSLFFALSVSAQVNILGCPGNTLSRSVTIASGDTTSAAISLGCFTPVAIQLAAFTGTAVSFTAAVSSDGTYAAVKSTTSGTALSYTVAPNTFAALDPKDLYGISFIKIVAGSAQSADRTLTLYLKGF